MIKQLTLKNFRSYPDLRLEFATPWTVFVGANGAGKSNLLEALFFLSMLRSFRTVTPRDLIRHGESGFRLGGVLERGVWKEELDVAVGSGNDRVLTRNGEKLKKSSGFIDLVQPVAFVPEDVMLISGSAAGRRRFADMYLSMLDPGYRHKLYSYNSALAQRNGALKRNSVSVNLISAFEPVMAENAVYIMQRRRFFASLLADEASSLLPDGERFSIVYRPDAPADSIDDYRTRLAAERDKEFKRGCTASGPQLDDFLFLLDNQPMRSFASSGERRKLAVTLKLAAYSILRKRRAAGRNIQLAVLVDDVTGELDAANRELFFEQIKSADQAFFTFTGVPTDPVFSGASMFAIADCSAKPLLSQPKGI